MTAFVDVPGGRRTFLGLAAQEHAGAEAAFVSHVSECHDCLRRREIGGSPCVAGGVYEADYADRRGVYELALERAR